MTPVAVSHPPLTRAPEPPTGLTCCSLHAVKRRDPTPRWRCCCRCRGCNCVIYLFLRRPPVPASH
eukprot:6589560-Prymnesium_polylepis.1